MTIETKIKRDIAVETAVKMLSKIFDEDNSALAAIHTAHADYIDHGKVDVLVNVLDAVSSFCIDLTSDIKQ